MKHRPISKKEMGVTTRNAVIMLNLFIKKKRQICHYLLILMVFPNLCVVIFSMEYNWGIFFFQSDISVILYTKLSTEIKKPTMQVLNEGEQTITFSFALSTICLKCMFICWYE